MSGPNTNFDPKQVAALSPGELDTAVESALAAFAAASTLAELKQARIAHAGERSPLALANREIGALPPQARKEAGQRMGAARGRVNQALAAREKELRAAELASRLAAEWVDVTAPVRAHDTGVGAVHPISAIIELIEDTFVPLGWEVVDGPEIENEWFIFDALNMGPDHPTRSQRDTYFVEPQGSKLIYRTETSNAQIHRLLSGELPVYMISPGRCARADEFDATHLPVFHQVEALVVDQGITFGHLRGTLDHFARELFGPETKTRVRPHYFPFTEPSAEMDLECFVCHGDSVGDIANPCRVCKSEGWIEWGGCGMVNPRVLVACGIDPEIYTGFAFGMGIERTLMFRNGLSDMRDTIEGDVRFSRSLVGGAR